MKDLLIGHVRVSHLSSQTYHEMNSELVNQHVWVAVNWRLESVLWIGLLQSWGLKNSIRSSEFRQVIFSPSEYSLFVCLHLLTTTKSSFSDFRIDHIPRTHSSWCAQLREDTEVLVRHHGMEKYAMFQSIDQQKSFNDSSAVKSQESLCQVIWCQFNCWLSMFDCCWKKDRKRA